MSKTNALDWSPDGQYIVTNMFNYIKKVESLVLINVVTGKSKTLLAPPQPASGYLWPRFSPDGRSIAVVHFQPNNNLWVIGLVDIKSGEFSEIFASSKEVSQVVWDETGNVLYYLVIRSKDNGIWQVNLNTKEPRFLVELDSSSLDYNAITDKFVYIEREAQLNIWRSSQTENGELDSQPLFQNLSQTNYPSLSPDNKHLAFIATESGVDSLWVRTMESNSNLLLLQSKENDKLSNPTWSPDGKQLLLSVLNKTQSQMVQFDMELGNSLIFESKNNVKMGKWSQDGRFMYWYEQIDDIWHVMEKNVFTAQQKIVLSYPVSRFESLDGKNLHYQKIGTINVHSRDLAKSDSEQSKDRILLPLRGTYSWDAHLNAIYYISRSKDRRSKMLYKMELSSGAVEELYPLEVVSTDKGRNLSIGDNGRVAYYTKLDKYRTDVVLMTNK
jgi:dipeptidyl aminopeptidase/acylaminoacyl peptidase